MKFVGICLITDQVPALTKFYETILRTKAEGSDVHAEINMDGGSFAIYSREAAIEDMSLEFGEGTTNFTLTFLVDDVDKEYERLQELGVKILNAPKDYPWGARSMQFNDIDGNVISFACRK